MLLSAVISSFDDEADPASLKVRMKLAYVYEKLDQRQEALDLVNSGESHHLAIQGQAFSHALCTFFDRL